MPLQRNMTLQVTIDIEILNASNFDDFSDSERAKYLVQELLDNSTWPTEGIACNAIAVTVEDKGVAECY